MPGAVRTALWRPPALQAPLVLVADDDEVIVGLISYRLEHSGYRVIAALDGQEALRLAHVERPALAVIDVMMPRIDGYELTRRLRGDEATRELPIILLTAQAQEADSDRGFDAGADAYVVKPFSPEELRALVAELLARPALRRAGRSRQAVA
jgi:two-component system phosphate regulon response regulator PhoB